jgi:hypothetical protein
MNTTPELEVALDVERRLTLLLLDSTSLLELPIAPLRGIADLVRLELALERFARIHRSKRSNVLINRVRTILSLARAKLRPEPAVGRSGPRAHQTRFRDTQPAA